VRKFQLAAIALLLILAACSRNTTPPAPGTAAAHQHEHKAPHGGTAVVLGHEAYHLELVRDAATGMLQAYVLDGEMEKFIRIAAPSLEVAATVNGAPQTLVLKAVANSATGETVGDTAQFEAQADWLKATGNFDAVLRQITIRGTTFSDVKFNFPKGNEK
jgi:hypothetical protein